MADTGKLCYKASGVDIGKLCYKAGGTDVGSLVHKVDAGKLTTITFAWAADGKDLDICAFWTGASGTKVGYGYNYALDPTEYTVGAYYIKYSGDKRGTDDAEWLKIKMSPWSGGDRTFDVHLNFFEYSSSYPASTCSVVVAQDNGGSIVLSNVACGTSDNGQGSRKALTTDPGVRITFDESGHLVSAEAI